MADGVETVAVAAEQRPEVLPVMGAGHPEVDFANFSVDEVIARGQCEFASKNPEAFKVLASLATLGAETRTIIEGKSPEELTDSAKSPERQRISLFNASDKKDHKNLSEKKAVHENDLVITASVTPEIYYASSRAAQETVANELTKRNETELNTRATKKLLDPETKPKQPRPASPRAPEPAKISPKKHSKPAIKPRGVETKPPVTKIVIDKKATPEPAVEANAATETDITTKTILAMETANDHAKRAHKPNELFRTSVAETTEERVRHLPESDHSDQDVVNSPETVFEVYVELLDIIETENSHNPHEQEASEPVTFAEFSQDQHLEEPLKNLTDIQERAPDQPPEITLVQTVELLESDTFEPTENQELIDILLEIDELLVDDEHTEIKGELLTPELTQKIIELFEVLGYEEPQARLIEMAHRRGTAFILQAVSTLAQTATKTKRQERLLVSRSGGGGTTTSTPVHTRFSRQLMMLLATVIFIPT